MSNEKGQACSSGEESLKVNPTEGSGRRAEEVGKINKGDRIEFVDSHS